jgi:UDP-2,3-diacylglucosamine hydrolase
VPAPAAQELVAPPGWRSIEFISDLHLQAAEAGTFEAWRAYMAGASADAVFILGDLFEVWVGDDAALQPGFAADCAAVLQAAAQRLPVFFMHGNRDFLVGDGLLASCGVTMLQDPTVLTFAGRRWLLSHGDALCLDDREYLQFRAMVRAPHWQRDFLARPMAERQAIARGLRQESEDRKRSGMEFADVDAPAALDWLRAADAAVLVHGHTHKPGENALDADHRRFVLSDWDADASPPRLQALRIAADGAVQRVDLA